MYVMYEPARWSSDNCQRMSDFDSCPFILIRMAYIVGRLVSICASSDVTFGISLHEVYVWAAGGRTLRRNKTFPDG